MTQHQRPYLSVVAAARNDNHGGNLLRRMQVFVDALIAQARRYGLPMELVLVEWNPPAEKPRLAEALRWPAELGPSTVRIIEVPPEIHRRYKHAEALPLYQMIAKNVGIRRAEGEFILATNIDLIFSHELMRFLSRHGLERGKMYRLDRHDVMTDVPVDAGIDEQLAWCRSHLLRVHTREGSFNLTPDGRWAPSPQDIVAKGIGVYLGRGWYPPECYFASAYRWVGEEAEVIVERRGQRKRGLAFDLEPGPGVAFQPFWLKVTDGSGALLLRTRVAGRSVIYVEPPPGEEETSKIFLHAEGGGHKTPQDLRALNFRVFRCSWEDGAPTPVSQPEAALPAPRPGLFTRLIGAIVRVLRVCWRGLRFLWHLRRSTVPMRIGLPLSPKLVEELQVQVQRCGVSFAVGPFLFRGRPWRWLGFVQSVPDSGVSPAPSENAAGSGSSRDSIAEYLHTQGCGDFTLMAREHWQDLRAYPEFDMFSINLDSVLVYSAHYGGAPEVVLEDPCRMYHIEHGSGWTPEGQVELYARLQANGIPWLDYRQVYDWANEMRRIGTTMIFNGENWGIAGVPLRETVLREGAGLGVE